MEKEKYRQDLEEIRDIMKRSSRFISLSGWSGIAAGIFALLGAAAAYYWVYIGDNSKFYQQLSFDQISRLRLLIIGVITLILALTTGIYFTTMETRKRELPVWDFHTQRLVINLAIPLITGGLVCLTLLFNGWVQLVPPLTLIFYGLALVNASKFTIKEIRSLGILEILLGLISLQIPGYGLMFWALGFGILHIIYGLIIPNK